MTSTVLILAGSWPIQVTAIDHYPGRPAYGDDVGEDASDTEHELAVVPPGGHHTSYVYSARELRITELPPERELRITELPPAPVETPTEAALSDDDALINPDTTLDANPPGLAFKAPYGLDSYRRT